MAIYRCYSCGSANVTPSGSVFVCTKCGSVHPRPMDENLKNAIDKALIDPGFRKVMDLYCPCTWADVRRRYKNVEEGSVDRQLKTKAEELRKAALIYATASQEDFDQAIDTLKSYMKLYFDSFLSANFTLDHYFTWNKAVSTFIENVPKYIPYGTTYKGMSKLDIQAYLHTYILEKVHQKYGRYPDCSADFCPELTQYAKEDPFVLGFLFMYVPKSLLADPNSEERMWTAEDFGKRYFSTTSVPNILRGVVRYTLVFRDPEEKIYLRLPRYSVKDGQLVRPHLRAMKENEQDALMRDYFMLNPEKKIEYDQRVAEHKQKLSEKKKALEAIQRSEQAINDNNVRINANEIRVRRLRNKIFGKKAALEEVMLLENETEQLRKNNSEHSTEIKAHSAATQYSLDDNKFYAQLRKEMDHFVAWEPVGTGSKA